jgi:alpha-glucosidase
MTPDSAPSSVAANHPWWHSAVIYQIYPRSFLDSNGDGIGDLPGIIAKVDYLAETLGIDAIWLSPFYPSPQADFGYDVSDYTDVAPEYGSLDDFDRLLSACHAAGVRVIIDFVPNHTSNQHPWFAQSRSSRDDPRRDWYVWVDPGEGGGPPNNWLSVFGGSAWEYDEATAQYYLHSFLAAQPDLNWRNPEVRRAMYDVLRFWLDRGVDGFRIDVAHHIAKDPQLRDNPLARTSRDGWKDMGTYSTQVHLHDKGQPEVHRYFREIRAVLDEYDDAYSVGEIHEWDWDRWASYYGDGDELHHVYDFSLIHAPWNAGAVAERIESQEAALPDGAFPNHVLGNHDEPRLAYRYGRQQARIAAMLLLTSRGTPTLYYGDEIGMSQLLLSPGSQLDPWAREGEALGRDGSRTPMQWTPDAHAGFCGPEATTTWLPVQDDRQTCNVATQLEDPDSILNLYRRLLAFRRSSVELRIGSYARLGAPVATNVYAYRRTDGARMLDVYLHFGGEAVSLGNVSGEIVICTDRSREGERIAGELVLAPDEGIVLRPDSP